MSDHAGESHRARAIRLLDTHDDGAAAVHALLAIEERLDVIAGALGKDQSRRSADDPERVAEHG